MKLVDKIGYGIMGAAIGLAVFYLFEGYYLSSVINIGIFLNLLILWELPKIKK